MKGIARFIVATMAGAGLGASAALAKRHLLTHRDEMPELLEPAPAGAQSTTAAEPASAEPAPAPVAARSTVTRLAADVADLDAARIRLRERAAALRAEMEGRAGIP